MVTYKFVIRKERDNALMLRITLNRKSAELALGVSLPPEELESVVGNIAHPKYRRAMETVKNYSLRLKDILSQLKEDGKLDGVTASEIRDRLKSSITEYHNVYRKDRKDGFLSFAEKIKKRSDRLNTKNQYEWTLRKMRAFCMNEEYDFGIKLEDMRFEDITVQWLYDFDYWMKETGLSANTRWTYMKNIKAIINRAIDEEITEHYPFRRFKIRQERTRKRSLDVETLRRFFDAPCTEGQKFYLDMFKLSFFLIGINPVDMYDLTEVKDGRVEYTRAKTGREYSIKVEPEAMEIINRWRGSKKLLRLADKWPNGYDLFLNNSQHTLKVIKLSPEDKSSVLSDISMYWARHSWATIARKLKIPKDDIALALGHSSGHNVTDIYINEDLEAVDAANRAVLDYVLYNRLPGQSAE